MALKRQGRFGLPTAPLAWLGTDGQLTMGEIARRLEGKTAIVSTDKLAHSAIVICQPFEEVQGRGEDGGAVREPRGGAVGLISKRPPAGYL